MTVNGQTDTDHTDTSAVANFYNHHAGSEHQRLALNSLEYELTLRIIRSVLGDTFQDKGLLNVADIGGGSGRYCMCFKLLSTPLFV